MTPRYIFFEAGAGWPTVGDEVVELVNGEGRLLRLVEVSQIYTGAGGNHVYCICEPSGRNWDELSDIEQHRTHRITAVQAIAVD